MLNPSQTISSRQQFMARLFPAVRGLHYAALKCIYPLTEEWPLHSDLDLAVLKREIPSWKKRIQALAPKARICMRDTTHASYVQIYFPDLTYLEIDLIHSFRRRHLVYLDAHELLEEAWENAIGMKQADWKHSYEYLLLFYLLNQKAVPAKYRQHFASLPPEQQAQIAMHLQHRFGLPDLPPHAVMNLLPYRPHILANLANRPVNQGLNFGKHLYEYLRSWFSEQAPMITFSGVDGAGKSTLLEQTRRLLTEKYRREVVVLRQRPSILPILNSFRVGKARAEALAAKGLPRQGKNQNLLTSLLRFAWYYLDYALGQFWVHWAYTRRGRLVLYDRYYFDYIVDPRRANMRLPRGLALWLYRWVNKPQLNVLLYADSATILDRKQELTEFHIQSLTAGYQGLFRQLSNQSRPEQYLMLENLDLGESLQELEPIIVHHLIN